MDLPVDPLTWGTDDVCKWLKLEFNLGESVLKQFHENDIDGPVLLGDVDHEALKHDLGITSFGQRSKILAKVRMLREPKLNKQDPNNVHLGSPLPAAVMNLKGLGLGLGDYSGIVHNNASPQTYYSDEDKAITLLEKPLRMWEENDKEWIREKSTSSEVGRHDWIDHSEEYNIIMDSTNHLDEDDEPLASRVDRKKRLSVTSPTTALPRNGGFRDHSIQSQPSTGKPISKRITPILITSPISSRLPDQGIRSSAPINATGVAGGPRGIVPTPIATSQPPTPQDLEPALQTTNRSNSASPLTDGSKFANTTGASAKRQQYLTRLGLSLRDIFNMDSPSVDNDSDSEDEWSMTCPQSQRKSIPKGHQMIIQRNMKRILRERPVFEIPDHVIYAPIRRRDRDVPVKVISNMGSGSDSSTYGIYLQQKIKVEWTTLMTGTIHVHFNLVRKSTWDTMLKSKSGKSASLRLDLNSQEYDITSIDFRAITGRTEYKMPVPSKSDDPIYPLYGESDASAYTTDEELYREVAKEEKERSKKRSTSNMAAATKTSVPADTVKELTTKYVTEQKELWDRVSRPTMEKQRSRLYQELLRDSGNVSPLDKMRALHVQLEERLKSIMLAIQETQYKNEKEVRKACQAADRTLAQINFSQWKLDLLSGPAPLPQPEDDQSANSIPETHSRDKTGSSVPSARHPEQSKEETDYISDDEFMIEYEDEEDDEDEDEEEKRQQELDAAFIDDSGMVIGFEPSDLDGYSSGNMDEDVIMDDSNDHSNTLAPIFTSHKNQQKNKNKGKYKKQGKTKKPKNGAGLSKKQRREKMKGGRVLNEASARILSPTTKKLDDVRKGKATDPGPAAHGESRTSRAGSTTAVIDLEDPEPLKSNLATVDRSPAAQTSSKSPISKPENGFKDEDTSQGADEASLPVAGSSEQDSRPPSPSPPPKTLPMKSPDWRKILTDDEDIAKMFRTIRKNMSLGKRVKDKEPYISAWQEYAEWMELDCGDSISLREFLKWKSEGNSTEVYRQKAKEAAAIQAAVACREKKEKEEREARERKERAEAERRAREMADREKEESEEQAIQPDTITIDSDTPKEYDDNDDDDDDDDDDDEGSVMEEGRVNLQSGLSHSNEVRKSSRGRSGGSRQQKKDDGLDSPEEILDISDEAETSTQKVPALNFKKRPRPVRNKFGDPSSESSNPEEEQINPSKHAPRRRVKRAMLDEAEEVLRLRKDAVKNELELKKRIAEQEMRAKIRGSMGPLREGEVLINPGHKKTERGVAIPAFLATKLKPHQIDGIRFLWKNIVMFDGGCILAHSMGLGKTFQVVAFLYVLLREIQAGNKDIPEKLQEGRVLLLMPPIVLDNWDNEFLKWIPEEELHVVNVRRLSIKVKTAQSRILRIEKWYKEGGVFLLGYAMFRELCIGTVSQSVKDQYKMLLQEGPSLIIADEGHTLKSATAKIGVASKHLKSTARVILTGYPLQNRLEEYWCMVDFVRPNFLGDIATFRHNYIRPISDGLYPDSSMIEKKFSSKKLKVLTELIKNFVLRKDQSVLRASLPKKVEFVISCRLSTLQYFLYTSFLPTLGTAPKDLLSNGHILLTICNHPAAFKATLDLTAKKQEKAKAATNNSNDDLKAKSTAELPLVASKEDFINPGEETEDEVAEKEIVDVLSQNKEVASNHWSGSSFIQEKNVNDVSHGYKVKVLLDILTECRNIREKVLVFTRSIPTLATEHNFRSMKLDGDTPIAAGSQGVNLVSASRVVIFDVGWNPSYDEQAIARAFRYGQERKVFVYRLQTFGTWEDKLYKTNLHKLGLSNRVVDKKNIAKTFSKTEMKSYFEPPPETSPIWASDETVEAFFAKPDTEDLVLRKVIQNNREQISLIVPQSELVREKDSDLTEADMIEIQSMIDAEQRRIEAFGQQQQQPNVAGLPQPTPQQHYQVQQQQQRQVPQQQQHYQVQQQQQYYQVQQQQQPYQPQQHQLHYQVQQQRSHPVEQVQQQYMVQYLPTTDGQGSAIQSMQIAQVLKAALDMQLLKNMSPNQSTQSNQTSVDATQALVQTQIHQPPPSRQELHWQGESREDVLERTQRETLASSRARLLQQHHGNEGVSANTTIQMPAGTSSTSTTASAIPYTTPPSVPSINSMLQPIPDLPQVKPISMSMQQSPNQHAHDKV
ncbi:hypothetical protein BGZ80_008918 [Entomortierella chlamydospora]|uniref:Snf2 family helicase n=1 Tax=Entomortierella chlamydospora TaxID=101097 RepID=A0A9P6N4I9_9FUNG|nr:hypothetical protein BGZ80_008918 [Entomortierella chlamydospora]